MRKIPQHSQRRALTDELHARPFTPMKAPEQTLYLAFKPEAEDQDAVTAERASAHVAQLIETLGGATAVHKFDPDKAHFIETFGDVRLRWERHSEFVSYTLTLARAPEALFTPATLDILPQEWLDDAPGAALVSVLLEAIPAADKADAEARLAGELTQYFAADSVACAWVTGGQALAASDFKIDARGMTRFAVFAMPEIGPRRLGRITQRLIELETYRTMAMLAFPVARSVGPRLGEIDAALSDVTQEVADARSPDEERRTLERLTSLAVDIQRLNSETAFRFGAARAYETIVDDRIASLREERVQERQDFRDFMVRRFRPAMRTCHSTAARIDALGARAERAANLLRTRVDVALEAQNQNLLASMDRRARLQLRLQQTVEGFSVVAISYYAVSLVGYVFGPTAGWVGLEAKTLQALLAVPVLIGVWLFLRRLKTAFEDEQRRLSRSERKRADKQ